MVADLEQLGLILASQTEILELVIKDGLAEDTKPRQRLAILKELEKHLDELATRFEVMSATSMDVSDIFTGPKLIEGISRSTS